MLIRPGVPYPLGATWDGEGVNFALYSEHAEAVTLCLFDGQDRETRFPARWRTNHVWHVHVHGLGPGTRYGWRVAGSYAPDRGLRFNDHVVLLDPYARAVDGVERWERGCFAHVLGNASEDLVPTQDPQLGAPRAVVVDSSFDWEDDAPPATPLHRSVIYEAHVRGLTWLHPEVPPELRGTYAGVAHPAVVRHLRELGITAIELMPVHAFVDDLHLLDRGLRNYWGYNSIGFFAPDVRYRAGAVIGDEVRQFKEMVKALHRAGIEVILDVVYNHTAEGNHRGPTLSFKGIDNPTYYRLVPGEPRYYFDYTGTGNTLNVRHPQVLALIMDSLRYWAGEMHVDGFRFDLASALARQLHDVDRLSSFFTLIHQSPDLSNIKLIAEPWDLGDGGYQVGNFPVRWAEWNGRYRDAVRSLWRGDGSRGGEIAYRLTGSSDLYEQSGRLPSASINLVTAHDGFTLRDLVSYARKHNEANGEANRDGSDDEGQFNCGVEGETPDPGVLALRRRQQRNLFATLLLSQGTPMIVAGDEFGHSQRGNNNAYCQDNELSWLDWAWNEEQQDLLEFVRECLRIRRQHPALHRSRFFQGRPIRGAEVHDIHWFRPDGQEHEAADWEGRLAALTMFLAGRGIDDTDERGRPLVDDDFLLMINAESRHRTFVVPRIDGFRGRWEVLLDTDPDAVAGDEVAEGAEVHVRAFSLRFLRSPAQVLRSGGAHHRLSATYRVQLGPQFGFEDLAAIVSYLARLGVTDLYTSPILAAAPGSTHGYDVADHGAISADLGGEAGYDALVTAKQAFGLGWLLDWVPNHMGIATDRNGWWADLLDNGPASHFAEFFDVDWHPVKEALHGKVLLPILGVPYGEALENGEIVLAFDQARFVVNCAGRRLPVAARSVGPLLRDVIARSELSADVVDELESLADALARLPPRQDSSPEARRVRTRDKEVLRRRFEALVTRVPAVADAIGAVLTEVNGLPGDPRSFDRLDALLQEQVWRVASWKVAAEEINYRRFFDINNLAALRMERPAVFAAAHALVLDRIARGDIQALRLDHTDGLYDPLGYFEALQSAFAARIGAVAGDRSADDQARPLPLLVEKILEPGEQLPSRWPVDGSTGYEFAAEVTALWVDPAAEAARTALYQEQTGDRRSFAEQVYESKLAILRVSLASEVHLAARTLERIASRDRRWRDLTLASLTRALVEVLAAFEVYRTYLREGERPSEVDARRIERAIAVGRKRALDLDPLPFEFLQDILLLRSEVAPEEQHSHARFALRFQQLTGPVMAKALEDTSFYRDHRLIALNDVGSWPARFGTTIETFHRDNSERALRWPLAMVTTSTHDSKLGEDVRARIAVLSEMPEVYRAAVSRLSTAVSGARLQRGIDRGHVYRLFQIVIGAWPFGWDGEENRDAFVGRIDAYMHKAAKEGKVRTSWVAPDATYERSLSDFVSQTLNDDELRDELMSLAHHVDPYGAANSLGAALLRCTVPGVADTYQGSELWNQSLVDPDNRRPVDWALRARYLEEVQLMDLERVRQWRDAYPDGRIKLHVTHRALVLRRTHSEVFARGVYLPIRSGPHTVAFVRSLDAVEVLAVATRFSRIRTSGATPWAIGSVWNDEYLRLPHAGEWHDVLTGRTIHGRTVGLADVLADLPVALLVRSA